jgi:hypothetical protein
MASAIEDRDSIVEPRSVVLMARIVDREGRCVRRADMLAINYSVHQIELDENQLPNEPACRAGASVGVDEIVFDDLQLGGWSIDGFGYNFRHAFELTVFGCGDRRRHNRYEVRYEFVTSLGEAITLCFEVGGVT